MSTTINRQDRIGILAQQLDDEVANAKLQPGFKSAQRVCMKARRLFAGFEQHTIWRKDRKVDEDERAIALTSLENAYETLDEIGDQIAPVNRLKYVKIMIAMSERVILVRHSSFETIRDYLRELATEFSNLE
jgi:hypothetical protein